MSDETPAPIPAVTPPGMRPRRAWGGVILLLLVVIAGLWLGLEWRSQSAREAQRDDAGAALRQRVDALEAALDGVRRSTRALETRAADNAATNTVLREELLGMGERAALLEDAVARLADNRLRGEVVLRLNEAEFLLMLGEERLRLFADAAAAVQAYALADAALAGLDDPVLATLRQTLAQELAALRAVPPDARVALRSDLSALGRDLERLPASRQGQLAAADGNDSRLMQLLSRLVIVRRVDARDAVLGPVQREATIAALRLQLEMAQAALARPDPEAYTQSLEQIGQLFSRLFDPDAAEVGERLARLKSLREAVLVPELPVLGATLQELRGLRATRSVGAIERVLPVPDGQAPDATEAAE